MAGETDRRQFPGVPGVERLLALTDAVVAIALTLLVLQLRIPVTHSLSTHPDSASSLWDALRGDDASALVSYLVAFVVIAQFWLAHHRVLRSARGQDEGLAWRNFGFLLALTLMPFTSDLLGRYGTNPLAITLFALNLIALSLATQWIFHYAAHHQLMTDEARSNHEERMGLVRSALAIAVAALGILLAWTDAGLASYAWLLFLLVPWLVARITRSLEQTHGASQDGTP